MKSRILCVAAAAIAFCAASVPLLAHHSFAAEFDANKRVNLTGVITQVKWQNPHVYFYIDVKDPATGKVTNWACEMGSPNGILSGGLTRDILKVGMTATVTGGTAKDGSFKMNAGGSVLINGKPYNAASSEGVTP
jgi:hypothetical protein